MVRLSLSRRPWLFADEEPTIALFTLIQQPDRTRIRSRWIGKNVANIGVQAVPELRIVCPNIDDRCRGASADEDFRRVRHVHWGSTSTA